MVDVSNKRDLRRTAVARGRIQVGLDVINGLAMHEGTTKKGDIISVAKVAGILGAKQTSALIPLCHQIPLDSIKVDIRVCESSASLVATASVVARRCTGVEMESLTAVTVTLLTLYDMCKSVNANMVIQDIKLISKVKDELV